MQLQLQKNEVNLPHSKLKEQVAKILKDLRTYLKVVEVIQNIKTRL